MDKVIKVSLSPVSVLVLRLTEYADGDPYIEFGYAEDPPGGDVAGDEWRAELTWPDSAGEPAFWRLRYWVGAAVQGRLSSTHHRTPGDVIASRIGGGQRVARAVNEAVYTAWPMLNEEAAG